MNYVTNRAATQPECSVRLRITRFVRLWPISVAILFALAYNSRAVEVANNAPTAGPAKAEAADKGTDSAKTPDEASSKPPKAVLSFEEPNLGDPLAQGKLQLLKQEIMAGLVKRHTTDNFARFHNYTAMKLNTTSGRWTGSELTGNCRLSWYEHLMRNHLDAPTEAEKFTRELHKAALGNHEGFAELLAIAAKKMDMAERKPRTFVKVESPEQALDIFKQSIADAEVAYAAALAPLTKSQIQELQSYIYPVLVSQNQVGHTLSDRGTGRRLTDLMETMDRNSLFAAADALVPITDPDCSNN